MSKQIVWASDAMINPAMLRSFTHTFGDEQLSFTAQCQRENNAGKAMGPEFFPPEIWVAKDSSTNYEKQADLFFGFGYWVVSGAVANVMRRFDLGNGNLYPTKVFRKDHKTPIGDAWFCLNFGNVKSSFLPDETTHKRALGPSRTFWMPDDIFDNTIALSENALAGPDIWIEKILGDVFFVSDRMRMALKDEGVSKPFGFKKCRIRVTVTELR